MTALTPNCDPDMSTTWAPFGPRAPGPRVRSAVVLLAVVVGAAFLAAGTAVPGWVAVAAAVIGLFCALVLLRRALRLAHRLRPVRTATS
jgi:membrane associated rhomboid family serine protease